MNNKKNNSLQYIRTLSILTILFLGCKNDESESVSQDKCLKNEITNVLDFGVDNTGFKNSEQAIQRAIDSGQSLYFPPGEYKINETLEFTQSNACYVFESSIIRPNKNNMLALKIQGSNVTFDGFVVDGEGKQTACAVKIESGSKNVTIKNCEIRNFHGKTTTQQYALWIDLKEVQNFVVSHCTFKNISQDDNRKDETDFSGGLYFASGDSIINFPSNGIIQDCIFNNIYTRKVRDEFESDADAIRFYHSRLYMQSNPSLQNLKIEIINCTFKDCQKRAFKISGVGGLILKLNHVTSNRDEYSMHAIVEIITASNNVSIQGLDAIGTITTGIWIKDGVGHKIDDVLIETTGGSLGYAAIRIENIGEASYNHISNLSISNVVAKNLPGLKVKELENSIISNVNVTSNINKIMGDVFLFENCNMLKISNLKNSFSQSPHERGVLIKDCTDVQLLDSKIHGVGNWENCNSIGAGGIFEVAESGGGTCKNILLKNISIFQDGYLNCAKFMRPLLINGS